MKVRTGFVSNSSSASFVVKWRENDHHKSDSPDEAIAYLFNLSYYSEDECIYTVDKKKRLGDGEGDWDLMDNAQTVAEWALKNTEEIDGHYETSGWTSMMNSYADFPYQMAFFLFALDSTRNIEIFDKKIHRD